MLTRQVVLSFVAILLVGSSCGHTEEALSLVDLRVGTDFYNGGLYPGAALPSSMVKLSPDTTKPSTAGYNPKESIIGFSHTHIGGTGGAAMYGQIRVRPETGELEVSPPPSPKENEVAVPDPTRLI